MILSWVTPFHDVWVWDSMLLNWTGTRETRIFVMTLTPLANAMTAVFASPL